MDSIAEQIVAMSAVRQHRWTRAEVDRLIDERPGLTPRYELDVGAFFASVADGAPLGDAAPDRNHGESPS